MALHPELQAIVDNTKAEHNEKVAASVEFAVTVGTLVASIAVTQSHDRTPQEEEDLQGFYMGHFTRLVEMYDTALGLTPEEMETTRVATKQAEEVVLRLMDEGTKEVVITTSRKAH